MCRVREPHLEEESKAYGAIPTGSRRATFEESAPAPSYRGRALGTSGETPSKSIAKRYEPGDASFAS